MFQGLSIDKMSGNKNMAHEEDGEYIITDLKFNDAEAELKLVKKLTSTKEKRG